MVLTRRLDSPAVPAHCPGHHGAVGYGADHRGNRVSGAGSTDNNYPGVNTLIVVAFDHIGIETSFAALPPLGTPAYEGPRLPSC